MLDLKTKQNKQTRQNIAFVPCLFGDHVELSSSPPSLRLSSPSSTPFSSQPSSCLHLLLPHLTHPVNPPFALLFFVLFLRRCFTISVYLSIVPASRFCVFNYPFSNWATRAKDGTFADFPCLLLLVELSMRE